VYAKLKNKIWTKSWSDEQLGEYLGAYQKCYFTYAAAPEVREHAASGGSVSGLLIHLLETHQIDGALVCRTVVTGGVVRPEFFIACSAEEILSAQGSKYSAVYFTNHALPLIKAFEGRLAVVALPCDAKILSHVREKTPELDAKIVCVIALFCGHNSEPTLIDATVKKLSDGHGNLVDYVYRTGRWRGNLIARFEDGAEVVKPFSYFSDYRNVYFFAQPKCHHCFDHFGYFCDISAGDIWSPRMEKLPIKHTALITRTPAGQAVVEAALAAGALVGQEESVEEVANGQARTLPFHYNVTARARVGKLFRLNIKDRTETKVRFVDYVIAFIAVLDERVSRTRVGKKLIFMLPRPVLKFYLRFFKALESI
jgi:coenzyme F420-reducing hydrogenase beta subunit